MKILFSHPNMPGQYKYLCKSMAEDKNNLVVFVTKAKNSEMPNVHKVLYENRREPSPHSHRYLANAERAILQGQEVYRACRRLKVDEGFVPDVIVGHPGWGDMLYMKDLWPDVPMLSFFEFYYQSVGADVNFDPLDPSSEDDLARVRTKNIVNNLALTYADWGITPTHWQMEVHPNDFKHKISVIHDGINTEVCKPDPEIKVSLGNNLNFKYGDEVVTYIARNFEPYRGFPTFMRAAEIILKKRPNCHIIAIGADEVSYGRPAPKGTTYRKMMMEQVKLDMSRMHFIGTQPYQALVKILQLSAAHIYLTYPFVLSWSMLEAMSIGCLMVGSKTKPVEEVITHGQNGFLANFFSAEEVADQVINVLENQKKYEEVRRNARQFVVDRYALSKLLPLHEGLVRDLADRKLPPPTHQEIMKLYQ